MTVVPPADPLTLPAHTGDERLQGVLHAALGPRAPTAAPTPPTAPYWGAGAYGLDRIAAFRDADPDAQAAVLHRLARARLAEAVGIEALGVGYAARRILDADSREEQQLFATFAADEAAHLAAFLPYHPGPLDADPFLSLLGGVIAEAPRDDAILVIQVALEGWGIAHYRTLAATCTDPALTEAVRAVLRDEARHHGAGLLLSARRPAGEAAVLALDALCAMVRAGPVGVIAAAEAALGPWSAAERAAVYAGLDGRAHAAERLHLLRELLHKAGADPVVRALERRGAWSPEPPEEPA